MTPPSGPPYRPTPALVRAVVVAVVAAAFALLAHRPALVVVAAPFVVWAVWGILRRPDPADPPPAVTVSARAIALGDAVAVSATAAHDDQLIDLAVEPDAGAETDPPWGALTDVGVATVKLRPQRWGRLDLPSAWVITGDATGMWSASMRLPVGAIEVSPIATVPGRGDAIPHPTGTAGVHRSRRPGEGTTLADIRRYVPGDRLGRINWRVTSRTGQLHTNATSADRDTDVLIVLDTHFDVTTADVGGEPASSLDATVAAAASLAEHYLRLGDRVGIHDLGGLVGSMPARSGIRQLSALTTRLGKVRLDGPRDGTMRPVTRLRPGTLAVVCTPLLSERVRDEIGVIARRGAAVIVIDTLPARLGRLDPGPHDRAGLMTRLIDPPASHAYWEEAWVLRRLSREDDIARLRALGIPVAAWAGVSGVAALAAALAAQRPVARRGAGAR